MKTKAALVIIALLLSDFALAQNSKAPGKEGETNLLNNPGFEESEEVNIPKKYPRLVEHGVELPSGNPVLMPVGVWLNPDDGWLIGSGKGFEYVDGKPGENVHTGKHAVKITSRTGYSAIVMPSNLSSSGKGRIPVSESVGLDDQSIQRNKPYKFSFYAKGSGSTIVTSYCYDAELNNIYSKDGLRIVEPETIPISAENQWQKGEGTIQIVSSKVRYIFFVICVRGEVWLDDVVLLGQ